MNMNYVLSIDPGKTTGWAVGQYDEKTPYTVMDFGITHDGMDGFTTWWRRHTNRLEGWGFFGDYELITVVVEGFALSGGNNFVANLDGVEIIGFLKGVVDYLVIQKRTDKALVHDDILKRNGMWYTGKQVGHTDGRDVNDAVIHGIVYAIRQKNQPTMKYLTGGGNNGNN